MLTIKKKNEKNKSFDKERKEECLEPPPLGFLCLKSLNKNCALKGVPYYSFPGHMIYIRIFFLKS